MCPCVCARVCVCAHEYGCRKVETLAKTNVLISMCAWYLCMQMLDHQRQDNAMASNDK